MKLAFVNHHMFFPIRKKQSWKKKGDVGLWGVDSNWDLPTNFSGNMMNSSRTFTKLGVLNFGTYPYPSQHGK